MKNLQELLPIGSVVLLKDAIKKLMIIGMCQNVQRENQVVNTYDYIGVLYPEGFLNLDSMMLFNHEQINDVVFTGYENLEREEFVSHICNELLNEK